ncbi:MAG: hypothetical protein QMC81_11400 [Thermoanaerobacterales bacterium]|nr:hypothetical protein [Bacillota bacterium]MDI6908075.1 hypothetical protein [Thermoanaerobacterales bacterium]
MAEVTPNLESNVKAEMEAQAQEWYDLLPIEKKLIWYSLGLGIVLLIIFIFIFEVI